MTPGIKNCGACGLTAKGCKCRLYNRCRKRVEDCECPGRRGAVSLGPRPSQRRSGSGSQCQPVASLPPNIQLRQPAYRGYPLQPHLVPSASHPVPSAPHPTPAPGPHPIHPAHPAPHVAPPLHTASAPYPVHPAPHPVHAALDPPTHLPALAHPSYENITYADRTETLYTNTGPPYNPSQPVTLPDNHQRVIAGLRNLNLGSYADRFATQSAFNQRVQAGHSNDPAYGNPNLLRTASDTTQRRKYKDAHVKEVEPATTALADARRRAPIRGIKTDPDRLLEVADAYRNLQDAHLGESDGRLEYLEVRPDGYRNPTSLHTHVEVIRDSLNAVITADPEIRRYEKLAGRNQMLPQYHVYAENPQLGVGHVDRPPSGSTMHSSQTSEVSSHQSGTAPPPFAEGSSIKHQCEYRSSQNGKQCPQYTKEVFCANHRRQGA